MCCKEMYCEGDCAMRMEFCVLLGDVYFQSDAMVVSKIISKNRDHPVMLNYHQLR